MNYEGAPGLEFGGGNTKIDPSVAASLVYPYLGWFCNTPTNLQANPTMQNSQ
jgi:hypothetical protein